MGDVEDLRAGQDAVKKRKSTFLSEKYPGVARWYSTSFVREPLDAISLQLCTPKVVGI
jgi:hypothetical protein